MNNKAFSLVEVLVAAAVLGMMATAYFGATSYGLQTNTVSGSQQRATLLAEEGQEAIRNMRDASFTNLTDGKHGVGINSSVWSLTGSSDTIDIYTREILITPIDAQTKQITSRVTWQQNPQRTGTVEIVSYMTNWKVTIAPTATPTLTPTVTLVPTSTLIPTPTITPTNIPNATSTPTPTVTRTPTPTPTRTPTLTPTRTPTPTASSCASYCGALGGVCRANSNQCLQNNETYSSVGSIFCTGGANSDTCCCRR